MTVKGLRLICNMRRSKNVNTKQLKRAEREREREMGGGELKQF